MTQVKLTTATNDEGKGTKELENYLKGVKVVERTCNEETGTAYITAELDDLSSLEWLSDRGHIAWYEFILYNVETGFIVEWTLAQVIENLNLDRSEGWDSYTDADALDTILEAVELLTEYTQNIPEGSK